MLNIVRRQICKFFTRADRSQASLEGSEAGHASILLDLITTPAFGDRRVGGGCSLNVRYGAKFTKRRLVGTRY